jgi:hypothetical protein
MEDGMTTKPVGINRRRRTFFHGNYPNIFEQKRELLLPFQCYLAAHPLLIKVYHPGEMSNSRMMGIVIIKQSKRRRPQ